ncbi:MAG: S8 family serine peptidase [Firmicutes bacterium]|nr:S8 family serine peptidase [Bacillota bacterium]
MMIFAADTVTEQVEISAEDQVIWGLETVAENSGGIQDENPQSIKETLCIDDLDRYENNQVLVLYADGETKLYEYQDKYELFKALEEFKSDESVEYYQPNFIYHEDSSETALSDDKYVSAQWYLKNNGTFTGALYPTQAVAGIDINVEDAWATYQAKRDVVVAVIDTGVNRWNFDLNGRIWQNTDEIYGNGIDDDKNGYRDDRWGWNFYANNNIICNTSTDEDDHGTHCASVIASQTNNKAGIAGIAHYDNIQIMSVKALGGPQGHGTTEAIVQAIEYAEDNGATICNLSVGGEEDDFILKKTILGSKMLFVAAAGNSTGANIKGKNLDNHANYPAAYNFGNVITVANLAADGRLHTSSDYGAKSVHIAAPGTDIAGATVRDGYVYMTGTSMAAPMVTAAAALVYTASEDMTVIEVKDVILNTARLLNSLTGSVATGAMLDVGAAVKYTIDLESPENTTEGAAGSEAVSGAVKGQENAGSSSNSGSATADKNNFAGDKSESNSGDDGVYIKFSFLGRDIEIKLNGVLGQMMEKILKLAGGL